MLHHILVKFNENVSDKAALIADIKALFAGAEEYDFVSAAHVYPNCVDRENRYDALIVIELPKDRLADWDGCALHNKWKTEYGLFIEKKAIFDREEA